MYKVTGKKINVMLKSLQNVSKSLRWKLFIALLHSLSLTYRDREIDKYVKLFVEVHVKIMLLSMVTIINKYVNIQIHTNEELRVFSFYMK